MVKVPTSVAIVPDPYRILKVKPDYLTVILNDGMVPSKPARITRQEFIDYFTKIA